MLDRVSIKEAGKAHFTLHTTDCVIAAALMLFIMGKMSGGFTYNFSSSFGGYNNLQWRENGEDFGGISLILMGVVGVILLFFTAYLIFVSNVISISGNGWFLRSVRGYTGKTSELFWGFKNGNYMNMVSLGALRFVRVFLWGLLLVVPGIIKSYSYFAADYIKTENPSKPAAECLEISERLMNGHKMDMFVFDLSFWGWKIIASFTCNILSIAYVSPYYYSSRAFAYEHIRAEAIASGRVMEQELAQYV